MQQQTSTTRGFTLIEILLVLAIIGILSTVVLASLHGARDSARYSRAVLELRQMERALWLYYDKYGAFPNDADRNIPPGLEEFLQDTDLDNWPDGPWGGSVYDWDAWDDPDTPGARIYQISIRFCPVGGPIGACKFPDEDWAAGFGVNSSMYYCVSGACRAHNSEPIDYPGHCVNC